MAKNKRVKPEGLQDADIKTKEDKEAVKKHEETASSEDGPAPHTPSPNQVPGPGPLENDKTDEKI